MPEKRNIKETGLIHIYTGEGKGKTTASVGLAVRALGHGMKVCYAHFNKRPDLYGYNEIQCLQKLGATILGFTEGHWSFNQKVTRESSRNDVKNGLTELSDYIRNEKPDLLILDEPTAGMNPEELVQMIGIIRKLHRDFSMKS